MEDQTSTGDEHNMADPTATTSESTKTNATSSNGSAAGEKQPKKVKKKSAKAAPQQVKKATTKSTKRIGKKSNSQSLPEAPKAKHGKAGRPFPQNTVEEALVIPEAIKAKNNGNPFDTDDLAKAVNSGRKAPKFFYLCASSRDYGLTVGSRDSATIELTELGTGIVYPESAEQQRQNKIKAFFNVPLFSDVFKHYGGGKLPESQFVSSVLFKKFQLAESLHDAFCELYQRNCDYLGLAEGADVLKEVKHEKGDDGAVVIRQTGEYAHQAFVIMPFSEKGKESRPTGFFDEVLKSLITPACNAADFGVQTAHSHGSDLIHHTIIRQLDEADLVVADLTDHNPNVLFELGIRIALDKKPVLLIRAKGTPPIFDVDQMMRVCEYDPRLWKTTIGTDISAMTDHVKGAWENKARNPSYIGILKTGQQALVAAS